MEQGKLTVEPGNTLYARYKLTAARSHLWLELNSYLPLANVKRKDGPYCSQAVHPMRLHVREEAKRGIYNYCQLATIQ